MNSSGDDHGSNRNSSVSEGDPLSGEEKKDMMSRDVNYDLEGGSSRSRTESGGPGPEGGDDNNSNSNTQVGHEENPEGEPGVLHSAASAVPEESHPRQGIHEGDIENGKGAADDGLMQREQPVRQSNSNSTGVPTNNGYLESRTFSGTNYGTSVSRRTSVRGSSLELRRLPENILLQPDVEVFDDISIDEERNLQEEEGRKGLLQKTCLHSKFSLRTQMMLSFGIISAFTILLVVVVCIVVALTSSALVKEKSRESFEEWAEGLQSWTAKHIAEELTPRLVLDDAVQIIYEATRDRLAGYPEFEDDSQVPFFDILSQTNKYPVVGDPIPLDWQIVENVNDSNSEEHFQERWSFYSSYPKVSSANAVFYMQGMCDPSQTNSSHYTFYKYCTNANNDITTGGVIAPSPTNEHVHRKASDLVPLLKALYEYHEDVRNVAVYFSNSGAGATVNYPGLPLDTGVSYESIGCEWANATNPYNSSQKILSDAEIQRCRAGNRHVDGKPVSTRLYNPTDRGWFRTLTLSPEKTHTIGPYQDAWQKDTWLMSVGRAIFDRITNEFVGCVLIDFMVDAPRDILVGSKPTDNSHLTITHWDSGGTVAASTALDVSAATGSERISVLEVGIDQSSYKDIYELVNYSARWEPQAVREAYENFTVESGEFHVKAYPMPPPPGSYDPAYEPVFLAFVSVSRPDVFMDVDALDQEVNNRVDRMVLLSALAGCIGFAVVMIVLSMVAYYITSPLKRMNEIAAGIIENFGGNEKKIEVEELGGRPFLKTELSEIVSQFQRMVLKFSGGTIAKSAKVDILELDNQFRMFSEFDNLYLSRQESSFKYTLNDATSATKMNDKKEVPAPPTRVHYGSNVVSDNSLSQWESVRSAGLLKNAESKGFSSPLFRMVVVLIILPLLLSTVTISIYVTTSVSRELPSLISDAKDWRIDLLKRSLTNIARRRVGFVSKSSEQPIRDLHILTRYTAWLLFGGLALSDAYPAILTGVEACKYSPSVEECDYAQREFVCDCDWRDQRASRCEDYNEDSRYLQLPFFYASSQDTWPNGDRNITSYPNVSYAPNATAWWENATAVPGATHLNANSTRNGINVNGAATYGHATTYDRLRSVAALPIHQVLYNYDRRKEVALNSFVSLEADGMLKGYRGCRTIQHIESSTWVSSKENKAEEIRPELCPLGKYGYDPRCRGWYGTGRKLAIAGKSSLYVTPPYLFATSNGSFAQSCTSPLVDPKTGEHVGQSLIDFLPTKIIDSFDRKNVPLSEAGFPILIGMESNISGVETIVGPNFSVSSESVPIEEVVFASLADCAGEGCNDSMGNFPDIAHAMRAGKNGTEQFPFTYPDGSTDIMHIAYSPVQVNRLRPINSSDFSRGVEKTMYTIYSLALVESENSLLEPFRNTERDIQRQVDIAIAILSIVIVFAACFVVYFSHRITISMVEPMYYLLELIKHINRLDVGEEAPGLNVRRGYGSSEVLRVRWTMEKLYKIIQCANAAFFAGEVAVAYKIFMDALYLFTRLDNKKATGVANNNLGNTMLTLYRTMKETGEKYACGFTVREIIGKGMAYFRQSIQLGEKAYEDFYDAEGWSPACLNFMQHLSNRYFNRAMFLLTVKNDHEKPKEIEELGKRDLEISRDMDVEIVEEGSQAGWGSFRTSLARFEVLLSRIRGHLALLDMGYSDDWEVDEMLDNAFHLLQKELDGDSDELFGDLSPAGRMQQIETELMRYKMLKGETESAAKIAIRMLVEDEFTLPQAQEKAVEVLMKYVDSSEGGDPNIKSRLREYQRWLEEACEELDTIRSSLQEFDREQLATVLNSAALNESISEQCGAGAGGGSRKSSASLRQSLRGDITMETF